MDLDSPNPPDENSSSKLFMTDGPGLPQPPWRKFLDPRMVYDDVNAWRKTFYERETSKLVFLQTLPPN